MTSIPPALLLFSLFTHLSLQVKYRKENNFFLKTNINFLFNGFNTEHPLKITEFDITLGQNLKLATLGFKNSNCDLAKLQEIFEHQINLGKSELPNELKIKMNILIERKGNSSLSKIVEPMFNKMEMVSRVLELQYQSVISLVSLSDLVLMNFQEMFCSVSTIEYATSYFEFNIVFKQYIVKENQ